MQPADALPRRCMHASYTCFSMQQCASVYMHHQCAACSGEEEIGGANPDGAVVILPQLLTSDDCPPGLEALLSLDKLHINYVMEPAIRDKRGEWIFLLQCHVCHCSSFLCVCFFPAQL